MAEDGEEVQEDPEQSDQGASEDDEIYEAYATMDKQRRGYRESRKKLKEIQKSRGFFKGELTLEERKVAVQKEKSRTRCAACGKIGHWAGDGACSKSTKSGPRKCDGGKKGSGRGHKGKGKQTKSYFVADTPLYFTLEDVDQDVEAYCNMVGVVDKDEENEMQQDSGLTELGRRRKKVIREVDDESEWGLVSSTLDCDNSYYGKPTATSTPWPTTTASAVEREELLVKVIGASVTNLIVPSFDSVKPTDLDKMTVRQLQQECDQWGIAVSGTKGEIYELLQLEKRLQKEVCAAERGEDWRT